MDIFKFSERLMSMDDAAWARHSNPWSGWSRISCLPLLALALWSRAWIGWWALIPTALAVFWTWLNPRLFGIPKCTDNWMSKATFGERLLLNRKVVPIPPHHHRAALVLSWSIAPGMLILIYGVAALNGWATICGLAMTILPKLWFLDRMVWLYEEMICTGQHTEE